MIWGGPPLFVETPIELQYRGRIHTLEFDMIQTFICTSVYLWHSDSTYIFFYVYIWSPPPEPTNMISMTRSILKEIHLISTSRQHMSNFIPAERDFLLPHCKQYRLWSHHNPTLKQDMAMAWYFYWIQTWTSYQYSLINDPILCLFLVH